MRAWLLLPVFLLLWWSQPLQAEPSHGISLLPPGPWSLSQFIDIARQRHPELGIASAAVEQARGRFIQAGLYPNPIIGPQFDNVGDNRNQWGDPGLSVTQEIVTAGKLRLARAAAAHQIAAADWRAVSKWYEVLTAVRTAYVEVLTAQRQIETTNAIVDLAEKSATAAQTLFKTGVGNQPDVLRAQVELEQTKVQRENAGSRFDVAWKRLALAAGLVELPPIEVAGTLEPKLPTFEWDVMRAEMLARASQLREASENILQAQQSLNHAVALKYPNVFVQAVPFYSLPDRDMRADLGLRVELPIFNRNQGNIHAAQGQLTQTVAQADQVQLLLSDRLADAFRRYEIARQKVLGFRERILPKARESVRLVKVGYDAGDPKYDYTTLLQTQQVLFQAETLFVEALGESWRTAAELYGLVQLNELFMGQ